MVSLTLCSSCFIPHLPLQTQEPGLEHTLPLTPTSPPPPPLDEDPFHPDVSFPPSVGPMGCSSEQPCFPPSCNLKGQLSSPVLHLCAPTVCRVLDGAAVKSGDIAVQGCAGFCRAVWGCTGLCKALHVSIGLCRAVRGCAGFCRAVEGCVGLCGAVRGCAVLCRALQGSIGLWRAVWGCVGLCGAV